MNYEYKHEIIPLTPEQQQVIEMGLGNTEMLNEVILDIINREGADGWEALYPFTVPSIWFRREKTTENFDD
jgi:hypothetical protein